MTGKTQRRLAAIVSTDVVGYSRLMGVDEIRTLADLRKHRAELIDPKITEHSGRIVKTMGDGLLLEFSSVVDATRCVIEIQRNMIERNAGIDEDRRIIFRIGVNLGDIIIEGEDIFGDGVNIAARLQEVAEPGGVSISQRVHEEVQNRLDAQFKDAGEHTLKNIAQPVSVWHWSPTSMPTTAIGNIENNIGSLQADKPSIAVLPFDNMSGDPNQEYFADGISEDLITALSKIRWFFVIARNSTFTYKGQAVELRQVAHDLGVRYIIEGSVRKAGNQVRVTAQLIDAAAGRHVWGERYDREIEDIFELQDEMTQTIVAAIEPELGAFERERAFRKPPQSLDAWEIYQRGLWHMWNFTKDDNAKALPLFQHARELDPTFAAVFAYEGYSHFLNVMLGYTQTPEESLTAALTAAKKAAALDDKEPAAYLTLGRTHMMQGEHDTSIAELERSLNLNPSFAPAYFGLGFALTLAGQFKKALEALDKAVRLNPRDPLIWAIKAISSLNYCLQRDYEAAVDFARQSVREPRAAGYWPYAVLASALGNLGQIEEARTAVDEALQQKPDLSLSYLEKTLPTKQPGELQPYLDGLRKAGLPE